MKAKAKRHQKKSRATPAGTVSARGNPPSGIFSARGALGWLGWARGHEWVKWLTQPLGTHTAPGGAVQHRLPRWFMLFLGMFGVGMILISLIGDQGLIAYYQLRGEAETLKKDVAGMEIRKIRLFREIEALQADPATIEHLARKNHGLVKPGDVILQLPGKSFLP